MENEQVLKESIIAIASEMFRFQHVFEKAISKLDVLEQKKYLSQYTWFSKRVYKAVADAGLQLICLDGELYDPGMAITPLNIEDFDTEDVLFVAQTLEPIIMQDSKVIKSGTAILGRIEK